MLIKLTTGMAGPDYAAKRGTEIDLPDDEAVRLINLGRAEPVKKNRVRRAIEAAPDDAVSPNAKPA
jgi:hypothetical protein